MNIILFNGPPGCGKDTATFYVDSKRWSLPGSIRIDRMSKPIKFAFAGMTNTQRYLDETGINAKWESKKDEPSDLLSGRSYRNWQQDFSEHFMKPLYGGDIFARLFLDRWSHRSESRDLTILVPDCGFAIEAIALRRALPKAGIFIIRIYRPGKNFASDTRNYLDPQPDWGGFSLTDLQNDGTEEEFGMKALETVQAYLGERK